MSASMLMALVLAALLGGQSDVSAQDECTWVVGVMGALKGDFAGYGAPNRNGVQLALDHANEESELACGLELHEENTGGSPDRAPEKANQLVDDERLVACVCGFFSGETLASGAIFSQAGVAQLSTGEHSVVRKQRFKTWFRAIAPNDAQARATAVYVKKVLDPKKVVIVHDDQSYSKEMARTVAGTLGHRVKGRLLVINPDKNDHSAVVQQIKQRNPQAVYFGGYAVEAAQLLVQMKEAGVRTSFVTDGAVKDPLFRRVLKRRNVKARLGCACSNPRKIAAAKDFTKEYREHFHKRSAAFAADTFDVTNIVVDALRQLAGRP